MAVDCTILKQNLGPSKCNVLPGLIRGMITTPRTFSLTQSNALLQTQWQTALLNTPALRIYLWPRFRGFKDESEKTIYEENELTSMFVRAGKYRFRIELKESLCLHKAFQSHSGNATTRAFLIDQNNYIWGTSDSSNNFYGFDLELLQAEKLLFSDGKVSSKSPIYMVLADNNELDINGAYVNAQPFINNLIPLTSVTVAQVGSGTTSLLKVTVQASCDGTSIDGLQMADFVVTSSAGATVSLTSVVETNGVYSLNSSSGFAPGDVITLVAAASLSIPGYEATAWVTASV